MKNFGIVKSGDFGGFIESEKNLSFFDNAWVYGYACVYGNAEVSGSARVFGDAEVYGNAEVSGDAEVYGDANLKNNKDYTTIKGFGTEQMNTTFFRCLNNEIKVSCGCFFGTIEEFRNQVKKTRTGKIAKEYLMIADLMEYHFGESDENENE